MAEDNRDSGSWWKTLPGILTGIGSTVAAVAALVVALTQAGLLGERKAGEAKVAVASPAAPQTAPAASAGELPMSSPSAPKPEMRAADPPRTPRSTGTPKPAPKVAANSTPAMDGLRSAPSAGTRSAVSEPELPTAPTSAGRSLFSQLAQANIHNSVGDAKMKSWLVDNTGGYRQLAEASLALLAGRALTGQGVDLDVVSYAYVKALGVAGDDIPAQHQIRPLLLRSALLKAHADKNGSEARGLDEIAR